MLVLWSELAADSDWIRAEARTGRQSDRLVAARLDDCLPPLEFASVQAVDLFDRDDFRSGEGWRQIVTRIGRLVGRPGLGDYVRCEQDADAGRWRGWIAANPGDPLIDKAKRRLALLMRPEPAPPVPQTVAPAVDIPAPMISTPAPAPVESATTSWVTWMRHRGWTAAIALLLLFGAIAVVDHLGTDDPAAAGNGAVREAPAPTTALASNAATLPMATAPAAPGKLAFCAPDKPFVALFTPGGPTCRHYGT
ncbi:hypothetical protein [Sphingopyxis panaciterrae]